METKLYTIQIAIVISSIWGLSQAVRELTCNTSTSLNQATVETYRFRFNRTNSNATQLSCYFVFEVTDQSEKILLQVSPNCSTSDELTINNGNNSCCQGCKQPPSDHGNSITASFIANNNTESGEFGFEILIITGKDASHCSSSVTRITVGTSPVIITSPNFPEKYPSFTQCSYIILSADDPNKRLSLTFEVINLEDGCYDLITLVLYNSEPIQICNFTSPDLVLLSENYTSEGQVYLRFNSDSLYTAHGFRLRVSQDTSTTSSTTATTNIKTTVETASTIHDKSTEKTTAPSRTAKDESTSGTSTTIISMAVVIGIVSVCLIGVVFYFKCYRNPSTKESTCKKPFHNPALDDYEMPVKTQTDKVDGYEELPADKTDTVQPYTYDSYLEITE